MNDATTEHPDFALPLPIPQAALQTAEQFSRLQPYPAKAQQVYRNTLAVYLAHNYLQMMQVATDLTAGDSWNPIMQVATNVADLVLPAVGRLECRPIEMEEAIATVPAEVWGDRIGYVVVALDVAAQQGKILGFTAAVTDEALAIASLEPPERLLDRIAAAVAPVAAERTEPDQVQATLTNLSQWLQGQFEAGWEAIATLLDPPQLREAYGFRLSGGGTAVRDSETGVRRAKRFEMPMPPVVYPIVMVLDVEPQADQQRDIQVQLYAVDDPVLPPDLQLQVLDETGDPLLETQTFGTSDVVELQLNLGAGKQFSVRIALGETEVTETFLS